jgi:hypothetical protein
MTRAKIGPSQQGVEAGDERDPTRGEPCKGSHNQWHETDDNEHRGEDVIPVMVCELGRIRCRCSLQSRRGAGRTGSHPCPTTPVAGHCVDRTLGHFRRYEVDELREKVRRAGLEVEYIQGFDSFIQPRRPGHFSESPSIAGPAPPFPDLA